MRVELRSSPRSRESASAGGGGGLAGLDVTEERLHGSEGGQGDGGVDLVGVGAVVDVLAGGTQVSHIGGGGGGAYQGVVETLGDQDGDADRDRSGVFCASSVDQPGTSAGSWAR